MANTDNKQTGRERLAEARAAQARKERNRKVGILAAVTATVVAVGAGGFLLVKSQQDDTVQAGGEAPGAKVINSPVKGVYQWSNLSRDHVTTEPKFAMNPPVGGAHNPYWANCGTYDKEIPAKYAVHSLEHGAVWITTNAKASAADVATLKKVAGQDYMLMSKIPSQASAIVLSAWGHQLRVEKASDPRVQQFISSYLQGPQTPEPGASCSGAYDPNTGQVGAGHGS